ncbi:MAG: ribosome biogenesis GTPase Der [Alteromonadaceae bacterium]|nr:MAG: ribosome biogenesis GTPase Der [Alteromonadaceae bacterium]
MLPIIALVGRPNVGKSTLFNRLTGKRDALVANLSGLTRDRKYGEAVCAGKRCMLIDTGGLSGQEDGIDEAMAEQSLLAIEESDVVLFIVDCKDGLTSTDTQIAEFLRQKGKNVHIVANKIDGRDHDIAVLPFYELGLGEVNAIAAAQGRGVKSLMELVLADIPEEDELAALQKAPKGIKMAIVGRPNVGKSTLVNRLLGEQRVVVYDEPGTTRDSIYIEYERNGKPYTLIDTAGVRRRKNIKLTVEKFSIVKTLQAIDDANVVIVVVDASEGIVDQDLHLLGQAIDSGRALVVAINKWDGLENDQKDRVKSELERRLRFVDFADLHFISALHGTGVGHLYSSVDKAYKSATERFTSNHLTRVLEEAVSTHQPPLVGGRRIKLRYAHVGGHNPPIVVIHGNQTASVPNHYVRYLEKTFRKVLDLHGTPIRIEFKSGENPFAGRKNKLTPREVGKRKRLDESNKRNKK